MDNDDEALAAREGLFRIQRHYELRGRRPRVCVKRLFQGVQVQFLYRSGYKRIGLGFLIDTEVANALHSQLRDILKEGKGT